MIQIGLIEKCMTQTITLDCPYLNGFADQNDPKALEYIDQFKLAKAALNEGRLYLRYLDGDRKGSIARLIPNPEYQALRFREPGIRYVSSAFQKGPWYCFESDVLYVIATWKGRKNRVRETVHNRNAFELLIGDDIETVWEKFDSKTAKEVVLQNPDQRDIDGNILAVNDRVMFINVRYGSRMVLERGTIKEFKVVVDSKKTSISTVIENDHGILSTLSHPTDMVYKVS